MEKKTQLGILVAVIVVAVGILCYFVIGSMRDTPPTSTADQRRLSDAIDQTGGDLNKLSPEMKKLYDEQVHHGKGGTIDRYVKPENNPFNNGAPGSAPGSAPRSSTDMGAPTPGH